MLSVCRSPGCVHSWCRARTELVITPPSGNTPLNVYLHAELWLYHASLISPCKDFTPCLNLSLQAETMWCVLGRTGTATHSPHRSKACEQIKGYKFWGSKLTSLLCKNVCHFQFIPVCPTVQTISWIFLKILTERPLWVALFSNKKALVSLA